MLELGAAVYVIKPFGIGELIALARAALQPRIGTTSANDPIVRVGALQINLATRSGTIDGRQLVLGPKEYLELEILAAARRQGEGPGSIQTLSHCGAQPWLTR